MAALTVQLSATAATTVTTAEQLLTTTGTASNASTKVGKSTGFGEVWSQGTTGTYLAGTSAPAPSGEGWLYDVTTLVGQTMAAGNWSGTLTMLCGSAITADVHLRAYKRTSGGVYTQIVDAVAATTAIALVATAVTIPSTAGTATAFATGDKLYVDIILKITTGSTSTTDTVSIQRATGSSMVTPGYAATPAAAALFRQVGKFQVPA